jgi:hypothetical protein
MKEHSFLLCLWERRRKKMEETNDAQLLMGKNAETHLRGLTDNLTPV